MFREVGYGKELKRYSVQFILILEHNIITYKLLMFKDCIIVS